MKYKNIIKQNFTDASLYDEKAQPQLQSAQWLADIINHLEFSSDPSRILEIGCGTGFLTTAIQAPAYENAHWLVSDLSPAMVARTSLKTATPQEGLGTWTASVSDERRPHRSFFVMDGERPCFPEEGLFDLIASSLCFQWFEDINYSILSLLKRVRSDGYLAFTTMGADSFQQWKLAHQQAGFEASTPSYPTLSQLKDVFQGHGRIVCANERHMTVPFGNGLSFLDHLRGIGAHGAAREARRPLGPGGLRRVIQHFDENGAAATYHVLRLIVQRSNC